MKIRQAHVTSSTFRQAFLQKYKLAQHTDNTRPTIFFGVYQKTVAKIMQVQAPVVCVWAGTDLIHAMNYPGIYIPLLSRTDVRHVVISMISRKSIELIAGFYNLALDIQQIPITPLDYSAFKPLPMGNMAYCYAPEKNGYVYQNQLATLVHRVAVQQGIPFHLSQDHHVPRPEMPGIYKNTFCNVRLTVHDGLPNTVVEMALMGRRSLWNGDPYFPGVQTWTGIPHVLQFIRDEQQREYPDIWIREATLDYINPPDHWMNI